MKKIYVVTLEDENSSSKINPSVLRELAFLLHSEIYNIDRPILAVTKTSGDLREKLLYNELYEKEEKKGYMYKFLSDKDPNNYYRYDPFIINDNSFGITTYPEMITDADIEILMRNVFRLANCNYKFSIRYMYYDDSMKKARRDTIDMLINRNNRVKTKVRVPILGFLK